MKPLNILYDDLDFKSGSLYSATDTPFTCQKLTDWLEKGEWLAAAKKVGAEKIFFVENNPVAVFAECGVALEEKIKAFNQAWCLSRPRLLFLASPEEITVYDLAQKPIDISKQKDWKNLKSLSPPLIDLAKASEKLRDFHRDNIESGRLFADKRFGDLRNRADKALIRDLKTVRGELIDAGLSGNYIQFAHAIIGRSIFIRYLEDRNILTKDYFFKIAQQKSGWTHLLLNPVCRPGFDFSNYETFFPRVLQDKGFTYALFKQLALDFNGDMFPDVDEEEKIVTQRHLTKIQDLLYGDIGIQKKLFFYTYRFDLVPLDLISSIYEEFYHGATNTDEKRNKARQDGAYYTPSVLAEFVLSRVLTPDVLKKTPRVMDIACGSGIFLVEAFRRIVRYEWHKNEQPLTFDELKSILKSQIAGIEVNEEAARITAFSLYLSMLHYLDPPAIDQQMKMGNRLPNLVATTNRSPNNFHCILPGNVFDIDYIESNPIWKARFGVECADVVVGNPPWGAPGTKADAVTKIRQKMLLAWCNNYNKPIGDKEPSQAFLWRALDFLKQNGKSGMLVSAGVLFKHSSTSAEFRKQWLSGICLKEVFNFVHVRKFFFKRVNSPFVMIHFSKSKQNNTPVEYWSLKQTTAIKEMQAVLLSKYDRNILTDEDLSDGTTWKSYWFGRYADRNFLQQLGYLRRLSEIVDRENSGRGYQTYTKKKSGDQLGCDKTLVSMNSKYDDLRFSESPEHIYNIGPKKAYKGYKIIVSEGIKESGYSKGRLIARFETNDFSFYRSIYGLKLKDSDIDKYKLIVGILWSSFTRYYFFSTTANWGLWYHKILFDELLQLPIVLNKKLPIVKTIINIVDNLRNYHPKKKDIMHPDGVLEEEIEIQRNKWETELDEAVYELYGLNEEQKDLIRDLCEVTLPFFYQPFDSKAIMMAIEKNDLSWIEEYVNIFCRRWNTYLEDNEEMRAKVHIGAHDNMLAVEFFPADKVDPWNLKPKNNSWGHILEQLGNKLLQPMGASQIVIAGLVYVVSDSGIIIIKRNEKHYWTRSLAREDADATICKAMQVHLSKEKG